MSGITTRRIGVVRAFQRRALWMARSFMQRAKQAVSEERVAIGSSPSLQLWRASALRAQNQDKSCEAHGADQAGAARGPGRTGL